MQYIYIFKLFAIEEENAPNDVCPLGTCFVGSSK